MKGMMLMMPLISLFIGFGFPAALSVYWLAQSAFSLIQDVILKKHYTKILDAEDAVRLAAEKAKEEDIEQKRLETERLRAEGRLTQNKNTSKKKIQTLERAKEEDRQAKERAAKRAEMGLTDEAPASQVGTRRFARGRAYVEDRFTNPDEAEELTALAATEAELGESADQYETDKYPEAQDISEYSEDEDIEDTEAEEADED
jgi:YidC/Oxa1 family membrane protein insertase